MKAEGIFKNFNELYKFSTKKLKHEKEKLI
jgi:hypothetical protein